MAVLATPSETIMVLEVQTGLTPEGGPISSTRSYPNVKFATLDQDILDVATAMQTLTEDPLISVRRDNRIDLIDDGE
ncbi:MAG TPA: DUF1659 domain-containing protein [Desulfosporosinus sp.]|nr:DUF1659 domain-containing protein [Desulfosporosinus sp.]